MTDSYKVVPDHSESLDMLRLMDDEEILDDRSHTPVRLDQSELGLLIKIKSP